jgi:hypothetical protein
VHKPCARVVTSQSRSFSAFNRPRKLGKVCAFQPLLGGHLIHLLSRLLITCPQKHREQADHPCQCSSVTLGDDAIHYLVEGARCGLEAVIAWSRNIERRERSKDVIRFPSAEKAESRHTTGLAHSAFLPVLRARQVRAGDDAALPEPAWPSHMLGVGSCRAEVLVCSSIIVRPAPTAASLVA